MITLSQEVRDQLDRWNRAYAPSVIIAKSFRGEDPPAGTTTNADPAQQQQQQQTPPVDLFAGIDMDNLPEEVRETLTKAKTEFASLQTKTGALEKEKDGLTKLARAHQSRADQAQGLLRKHNLVDDPTAIQQRADPGAKEVAELTDIYTKEGMPPAEAKALAMMVHKGFNHLKGGILSEVGQAVGPHLANVGMMQVDRMLVGASELPEYSEYLQDPLIHAGAKEILAGMVQSGSQVTQAHLDTAIKMSIGERLMKGENLPQQQQQQVTTRFQQQQPNRIAGGTRFGGNPSAQPQTRQGNQVPNAATPETAKAALEVANFMKRGLPIASKK